MITFSKLGSPQYGRLGNQLFQIAGTIGIAKKNDTEFVFPEWGYSKYFKNALPVGQVTNAKKYRQKHFNYRDIFLNNKVNWDIVGFFQSELFFEDQKEVVRFYFEPAAWVVNYINEKYKILSSEKTCSVHIRRGDFLKQGNVFPSQPLAYYQAAIDAIDDDLKFIFFSDDIEWCKENFKGDNFYFIEHEEDIIDLLCMSFCSNHIISNSSFSWWGAWLNPSATKRVLCPENWFGPGAAINKTKFSKDLYLPYFEKVILPKTTLIDRYPFLHDFPIYVNYRFVILGNFVKRIIAGVKRRLPLNKS